jgi:hypothetical protein
MRSINKWVVLTIVLSALMVTPAVVFADFDLPAIINTTVNYTTSPWSITVNGTGFDSKQGSVFLGDTKLL